MMTRQIDCVNAKLLFDTTNHNTAYLSPSSRPRYCGFYNNIGDFNALSRISHKPFSTIEDSTSSRDEVCEKCGLCVVIWSFFHCDTQNIALTKNCIITTQVNIRTFSSFYPPSLPSYIKSIFHAFLRFFSQHGLKLAFSFL